MPPSLRCKSTAPLISSAALHADASLCIPNKRKTPFTISCTIDTIGAKRRTINRMGRATLRANLSGFEMAYVFGRTSAKINIKMVMTAVAAAKATPPPPNKFVNKAVVKTEAKILTRLLPSKIPPKSRSRIFRSFVTIVARLSPSFSIVCMRTREAAVKAVSELEKKPEHIMSVVIMRIRIKFSLCKRASPIIFVFHRL